MCEGKKEVNDVLSRLFGWSVTSAHVHCDHVGDYVSNLKKVEALVQEMKVQERAVIADLEAEYEKLTGRVRKNFAFCFERNALCLAFRDELGLFPSSIGHFVTGFDGWEGFGLMLTDSKWCVSYVSLGESVLFGHVAKFLDYLNSKG